MNPRWHSGKEAACQCRICKRYGFDPWVGKILWSRKWYPAPIFLPGRFCGWKTPVGYSPWDCKVRRDWGHINTHTHTHSYGEKANWSSWGAQLCPEKMQQRESRLMAQGNLVRRVCLHTPWGWPSRTGFSIANGECVITASQRGWLRQEESGVDEHRGEEHVFSHTGLGAHPGGTVQLGALDQGFPWCHLLLP